MSDGEIWRVAPGVTIYVNDDKTFFPGELVSPEDFESLAEFRGQLAARRIIGGEPAPDDPGTGGGGWDFFSVDDALDPDSPNPISNRAACSGFVRVADSLTEEQLAELLASLGTN